jgi:hypothetical protein
MAKDHVVDTLGIDPAALDECLQDDCAKISSRHGRQSATEFAHSSADGRDDRCAT